MTCPCRKSHAEERRAPSFRLRQTHLLDWMQLLIVTVHNKPAGRLPGHTTCRDACRNYRAILHADPMAHNICRFFGLFILWRRTVSYLPPQWQQPRLPSI